MIKKVIGIIFACVVASVLSLVAYAASSEAQEEPMLNYIYTDIEENYVSDYRLYEQVMYGQIVFYTNISNGDITSDPVVIELPANVETIFVHDGTEIAFTNNAEITKIGSYSLTVIANGEDILGGSESDRYYGLFRFRIMESSAIVPPDPGIDVNDWEEEEEFVAPPFTEEVNAEPETEAAETSETAEPDHTETVSTEQEPPSDGVASQPASTTAVSGGTTASGTEMTQPTEEVPLGDTTLISEAPTDTNIRLTTKAGTEIYTNIPRDMRTSGKVTFSFTTDVQYKLYCNGSYISGYLPTDSIVEKGKYQLFIYDGSGTLPAEFDFEITGRYVSGITEYTIPIGCKVDRALYEGNMIRSNINSVDLGSEGTYSVDIVYGAYSFTETFILDNTAPVFGFDRVVDGIAEGGTVSILFESEDVDAYEIYKDGVLITVKKLTLSEPGVYTVKVFDQAGNVSEQTFELLYKMNGMAVVVIILLIAIITAVIVFFVMSRKRFIIR